MQNDDVTKAIREAFEYYEAIQKAAQEAAVQIEKARTKLNKVLTQHVGKGPEHKFYFGGYVYTWNGQQLFKTEIPYLGASIDPTRGC